MKGIDSNFLVYASLDDHPAVTACESLIAANLDWITNIVNLVELYRILIGVYGVAEAEAESKFADFRDGLVVESLTTHLADAAMGIRRAHGIDFNDAVLLETCRQRGVTVLATDDRKLAVACASFGISVEDPIDATLRAQMAQWESHNLPGKGLPRVLMRIHRWLEERDVDLAAEFHAATQGGSRLV